MTSTSFDLTTAIRTNLCQVYDPEIPMVNIVDLGLIYGIEATEQGEVSIQMTLTNPNCPVADSFPGTVQQKVLEVPGVTSVTVTLVWDPPWSQEQMSEAAKLQLGIL